MLNLFKKNQTHFGLDISDISLKLMQIEKGNVFAYSDASIPNPAGGSGSGAGEVLKDQKTLVKIIKQAADHPKSGKITTKNVVASIPEAKSFVRVIQMQALSEDEAGEAIPWEAEQYIPMPVGQVYLDWVILNRPSTGSDSSGKMTVLITATPKEYIDDYVAILKEAGLQPVALEVESQATARSLISPEYEKQAVLIADINTIRTSLIIYDHGTLQFTSSIPIAGNVFSEKVSKAMNISFEEAEKHKREVGLEEPATRAALAPVLENLVEEIKNTIRFYEEHEPRKKVSRLILSGGSSKLKHLPSFLHEKFSAQGGSASGGEETLRVELGNPWGKILGRGMTAPISREDSLSYATAIGLALREIE